MRKILLMAAASVLLFTGCKKTSDYIPAIPVAAFSTGITEGHNPGEKEIIQLNNTSTENSTYLWDFGNGTSSSEKNPSISYKMHGFYTITLSITDNQGMTASTSTTVTVLCKYKGGDHSNEPL